MKRLKISQTIQKLIKKLQECKHCIATFAISVLLIVPHNISAVCSSNVDMGTHNLVNVGAMYFNGPVKIYMPYMTFGGVHYASPLVSDGLFDSSYSKCTSTNGNQYYQISSSQRASACPDNTTLISLGKHKRIAKTKSCMGYC